MPRSTCWRSWVPRWPTSAMWWVANQVPDPEWHRMGIVRYPTRRSFIDMQARPDFQEKYVHKQAGMEFTIIAASLPLGPVRGEPDGSGLVRFTLFPTGSGRSGSGRGRGRLRGGGDTHRGRSAVGAPRSLVVGEFRGTTRRDGHHPIDPVDRPHA